MDRPRDRYGITANFDEERTSKEVMSQAAALGREFVIGDRAGD